mgnify:CR=1 FL=1
MVGVLSSPWGTFGVGLLAGALLMLANGWRGMMVVLGVMVVRALDRAQERAGSGFALRLDTVSGHADILVGKKPGYLHKVADAINGTVQARRTLVEKI